MRVAWLIERRTHDGRWLPVGMVRTRKDAADYCGDDERYRYRWVWPVDEGKS